MPTYQYACTECGHQFETVQSFSEDALTDCPQCTGRLRKVFNAVGIVFKGSGFYRTDSRDKSGAKSASGAPSSDTKTDVNPKSDSAKSESSSSSTTASKVTKPAASSSSSTAGSAA